MTAIQTRTLPDEALLARYRDGRSYTDCYSVDVAHVVSHAAYVEAFYTSAVFKVERQLLAWFVSRPATDQQANALATGQLDAFSAWTVEGRSANQLLLCDFQNRTRSWLMTSAVEVQGAPGTRLYFGSAVVPVVSRRTGEARMGFVFRALLVFHQIYSRVLLRAAASSLQK